MSRRVGTMMLSCVLLVGCKPEASTADPEAGSNLLGGEQSTERTEKRGKSVPVKCITDPSDPDCEEVLGYTRTDDDTLEFGETCRTNLCHARGECSLDPEGSVECECDEGASGLNCERGKK